jgi:hypothetical protein
MAQPVVTFTRIVRAALFGGCVGRCLAGDGEGREVPSRRYHIVAGNREQQDVLLRGAVGSLR